MSLLVANVGGLQACRVPGLQHDDDGHGSGAREGELALELNARARLNQGSIKAPAPAPAPPWPPIADPTWPPFPDHIITTVLTGLCTSMYYVCICIDSSPTNTHGISQPVYSHPPQQSLLTYHILTILHGAPLHPTNQPTNQSPR